MIRGTEFIMGDKVIALVSDFIYLTTGSEIELHGTEYIVNHVDLIISGDPSNSSAFYRVRVRKDFLNDRLRKN